MRSSEFLVPFVVSASIHAGLLVPGLSSQDGRAESLDAPARVVLNIIPPTATEADEQPADVAPPERKARPGDSERRAAPRTDRAQPQPAPAEAEAQRDRVPERFSPTPESSSAPPKSREPLSVGNPGGSSWDRILNSWDYGGTTRAKAVGPGIGYGVSGIPAPGGPSGRALGGGAARAIGFGPSARIADDPSPPRRAPEAPAPLPSEQPDKGNGDQSVEGPNDDVEGDGETAPAQVLGVSKPTYPSASRRHSEEGRVVLSVEIRADGTHGAIRVVRSSGHARLDQAAVQALQRATFIPATKGGKRVTSTKQVAFTFRLVDAED